MAGNGTAGLGNSPTRRLKTTKDEIRRATTARRAIKNPVSALKDLTNEALSSPLPDETDKKPDEKPPVEKS